MASTTAYARTPASPTSPGGARSPRSPTSPRLPPHHSHRHHHQPHQPHQSHLSHPPTSFGSSSRPTKAPGTMQLTPPPSRPQLPLHLLHTHAFGPLLSPASNARVSKGSYFALPSPEDAHAPGQGEMGTPSPMRAGRAGGLVPGLPSQKVGLGDTAVSGQQEPTGRGETPPLTMSSRSGSNSGSGSGYSSNSSSLLDPGRKKKHSPSAPQTSGSSEGEGERLLPTPGYSSTTTTSLTTTSLTTSGSTRSTGLTSPALTELRPVLDRTTSVFPPTPAADLSAQVEARSTAVAEEGGRSPFVSNPELARLMLQRGQGGEREWAWEREPRKAGQPPRHRERKEKKDGKRGSNRAETGPSGDSPPAGDLPTGAATSPPPAAIPDPPHPSHQLPPPVGRRTTPFTLPHPPLLEPVSEVAVFGIISKDYETFWGDLPMGERERASIACAEKEEEERRLRRLATRERKRLRSGGGQGGAPSLAGALLGVSGSPRRAHRGRKREEERKVLSDQRVGQVLQWELKVEEELRLGRVLDGEDGLGRTEGGELGRGEAVGDEGPGPPSAEVGE